MNKKIIGNKSSFAIEYAFFENHTTEIALFINSRNILAYTKNEQNLTTRWNLDEIVKWLRSFIDNIQPDPYPVECEGEYAAMKDIYARDFDSDDDDILDSYYDSLYEWNLRHRWHHVSEGAILSDVYFEFVGDDVEISWNNQDAEDDVVFTEVLGCERIPKKEFVSVMEAFIIDYTNYWF